MLGFPQRTEFNKRIPKQKFYENLTVTPALKKAFAEQIRIIYWRNKLSGDTLNLDANGAVTEIEVLELRLNAAELDEAVLKQIDREIPYHILFVLEYEGKYRCAIGYKEVSESNQTAFKVSRYFYTDWMDGADLPVKIEGLSIDAVYENFVRQIAGDALCSDGEETLRERVDRQAEVERLQKQIAVLESRIRKEKQPNKKFEMVQELRELKKQLCF